MSLVPAVVDIEGDRVMMSRSWPREVSTHEVRLRVEGRDGAQRLRAGELWLRRSGEQWRVERAHVLPHGHDPRLPGLAAAVHRGELLVHRPGRRAVVRRDEDYLKVVRPDRVQQLVGATELGPVLAARADWVAPSARRDPVGPGVVRLSLVPGEPLHVLARRGRSSELTDAWGAFVEGWPRIVAAGDELPLRAHTAQDEAAVVSEWVERAATLLPGWPAHPGRDDRSQEVVAAVREAGRQVQSDLLAGQGRPLVPAHRDLHDKQVLVGERLGILDLDTAALAEIELDLANLAEHVRLRGRQGLWSRAVVDHGSAAVLQTLELVGGDPQRFAAYRAATRLRLACLYLFRPRWAALARTWVGEVAGVDERSLMNLSSPRHRRGGG